MHDWKEILYAVLKYAAYAGWCIFGTKLFSAKQRPRIVVGLAFGFLRLLMGLSLGIAIWLVSTAVYSSLRDAPAPQVLTYLAVYVPVRWFEWSLMVVLMSRERRSWKSFFIGIDSSSRWWRLGGICISCLADIPMIVSIGSLPLGRFMC